jgi:hypothetical protein
MKAQVQRDLDEIAKCTFRPNILVETNINERKSIVSSKTMTNKSIKTGGTGRK